MRARRRLGLRLHAGADLAPDAALPARYRSALANAGRAAERGEPIVYDEPRSKRSDRALAKQRYGLAQGIEARPDLLDARFESYIEAAMALAGHRIESLRRELDAGLERLIEPLLATGALEEKSFDDFAAAMARAVLVARLAGFAPGYFSKLFRQSEGTTFQHDLLALRLERAAEMLEGTKLGVERVRQLSGFRNRAYFNRAFKKAMGVSPREHRRHFTTRMRREAGYEPRHPAGTLSPG
jgi:AraC-like DNA-binding protein